MNYKIALLLKKHYRNFCEEKIKSKPENIKLYLFFI